ncbi:MAG: hypothetical protein Q8O30_01240 [Candidatus Omnitrophota bacterium]|nr:hypothetical protein [Candidatus Omnitrophota bacterium]
MLTKFKILNVNIVWQVLQKNFSQHYKELLSFKFHLLNPVFWLFFLILFLITLRFWATRKAFSFCTIIAVILLACTKVESSIVSFFAHAGEKFDPFLIRIGFITILMLVLLYYFFIKGED